MERITAYDVQVGDYISKTRGEPAVEVTELSPGEKSVYITLAGGYRLRPRYTTKLWRLTRPRRGGLLR